MCIRDREMLSLGTITKIGDIVDIMNRNLESNLNYGEMIWFGEQFLLAGDCLLYTSRCV